MSPSVLFPPVTSRRTLLHGLAAAGLGGATGAAGCLSAPVAGARTDDPLVTDGGPGDDGTRPSDRDRPADARARARVVARDPAPDLPVVPRVSVVDPWVTGGSPPVVRVDVDNPTDSPVVVGEYRDVVFQYAYASDAPLVWLPHSERSTDGVPDRERPDYEVAGDGCWRLTSGVAVTEEYGTVEIPAGGTLTAFVGLYATPEADAGADATGCLPRGQHRFESTYSVFPEGIDGGAEERDRWGFVLSVEALDAGR